MYDYSQRCVSCDRRMYVCTVVSSPGSGWVRRQLVKLGNSVLFGFIKRLQVPVQTCMIKLYH